MPPLTRERILRTAVAMADQDGLDAVTLRRIAAELGVHVTSLYNHVPTRDAVTDGIVETLLEEAGLPAGVLNVITARSSGKTMEPLIKDARTRKLSFTGSTEVGKVLIGQAADQVLPRGRSGRLALSRS